MKQELKITTIPTSIEQTSDGRKAAFVAGNGSPAHWYWAKKPGDKARALRAGYNRADIAKLIGFRPLGIVCDAGCGYWYEVNTKPLY